MYTLFPFHILILPLSFPAASQLALVVKNLPANAGDSGDMGSIPGGGYGNPLTVFLPGKFHGQRSLAGYSPWNYKSQMQLGGRAHSYTVKTPSVRDKRHASKLYLCHLLAM